MCLDVLYKKRKVPKTGTGWKIMKVRERWNPTKPNKIVGLFGQLQRRIVRRGKPLYYENFPLQTYVKAHRTGLRNTRGRHYYNSGFHVYLDDPGVPGEIGAAFSDLPGYVRVKVHFRKGRVVGRQHDRQVVVADEIFIPASEFRRIKKERSEQQHEVAK